GLGHVHPHILRHSFATHLLAGGANLRLVLKLFFFTDTATTAIYALSPRDALPIAATTSTPSRPGPAPAAAPTRP
ncbi:MAG: tyrosine-type recombinase/integrase, partial [Myxococcales bacterium]|nr:tyrosine-type recombinase/integrase [Myxococcales bacterium]